PCAGETLPERAQHGSLDRLRTAAQIADHRCARLLRVRDPLAGKQRASDKRDEFAPLHLTLELLLDSGGRIPCPLWWSGFMSTRPSPATEHSTAASLDAESITSISAF